LWADKFCRDAGKVVSCTVVSRETVAIWFLASWLAALRMFGMMDIERAIQEALSLVMRGDYAGARPIIDDVLGRVPLDYRARYVLSLAELAAGEVEIGEVELRRSLLIDARPGPHWHQMARLVRDAGHLAVRCIYLERACAADPSSASAHSDLAAVSPMVGKPRQALTAYRRAIALRPKDPALFRRYADLVINGFRRRDHGAFNIARAVVLEDPSYVTGYRFLFSDMMASVHPALARACAERSIMAGGMDGLGFRRLGQILRHQNLHARARASFKRASVLDPGQSDVYVSHFFLSRNRADPDYAARILLAAWYALGADAGPAERTKLLGRLAEIHRAIKHPGKVPGWIEVLLGDPKLAEKDALFLKRELARLRLETGELEESAQHLTSLVAEQPEGPSTYLLAERSNLLLASGQRADYRALLRPGVHQVLFDHRG
jgi:Tfp pilus assembly protein PilF